MYVNTLITLQENLSTYGIDGKKITGHVTITSPGLIKCYVQNLKKQASGQTYALYAFSKAKDKGVRLGNLGSEKETKWIINEKNIENSGINLEELDGVAIVVEDDMRGADTILMGFKNNRYMIIPLVDDIFKKRAKPGKSGGSYEKPQAKPEAGHGKPSHKPEYHEKPQSKPEVGHGKPSPKPEYHEKPQAKPEAGHGKPSHKPECHEKPPSKPCCHEGPLPKPPVWPGNPPAKPEGHKNPPPRNEMKIGMVVEPDTLIEESEAVIIPKSGMPNQGGPGPAIPPRPGMPPQGGPGPVIVPQPGMPNQGGPGPAIPPRPGMPPQGGPGPVIIPQPGMSHQGIAQQVGYTIETEVAQNYQGGNMAAENQNDVSEDQDFTKVKILDKKAANKVGNKIQEERMDAVDFELLKIAERLKQIGKQSSEKQEVNLEDSLMSNDTPEDSKVREDNKNNEDEVSKELQRIINMLKENQEIKQKTKGIEEQIERMRRLPQTHKLVQKSDIEKNIESRYMAQQLMGEEQEDDIEEEDLDTSPRKALNFMSLEKQQITTEETINQKSNNQMENLEQEENINGQDEIDYIYEIDKKIREIETKRKQQENNKY